MWARRSVAEGIGTFFLVFIGAGAVAVDAHTGGAVGHVGIALAFAFVVLGMVYAIGHISGAHINPAVTLGFWSAGRFPREGVLPYLTAQCSGAGLAGFGLFWILDGPEVLGATVPSVPLGPAFGLELLLTFALMFVIMAVATDRRVAGGFAGLAIGLTVGFGALMGGPLTGASMNPARSLGPAVAGGGWTAHWLYWAAPVLGAVMAAATYDWIRSATGHPHLDEGRPMGVRGPIEPKETRGPVEPMKGAAPIEP